MNSRRNSGPCRVLEVLVMVFTFWAGIVTFIAPYLLKQQPPKIYQLMLSSLPDYQIGIVILFVVLIQSVALAFSPMGAGNRAIDPVVVKDTIYHLTTKIRSIMIIMELMLWSFLCYMYIILWVNQNQANLASGMSLIVAGMASVASYCLTQDKSRQKTKEEISLNPSVARSS